MEIKKRGFEGQFVKVARVIFSFLILIFTAGCESSRTLENDNFRNRSRSVVVSVTGIGETLSAAEKNGLRNAIEQVYGALIISKRTTINDVLIEEDLSFSRGIILSHSTKVVRRDKNYLYYADMIVTVSASRLGELYGVIAEGDAKNLPRDQFTEIISNARSQINSELSRLKNAEKLVQFIASEFPIMDAKIIEGGVRLRRSGQQIDALVDIDVKLNEGYRNDICLALDEYTNAIGCKEVSRNGYFRKKISCESGVSYFIKCGSFYAAWSAAPPSVIKIMHLASEKIGVCLRFKTKSSSIMTVRWYKLTFPEIIDRRVPIDEGDLYALQQPEIIDHRYPYGFLEKNSYNGELRNDFMQLTDRSIRITYVVPNADKIMTTADNVEAQVSTLEKCRGV